MGDLRGRPREGLSVVIESALVRVSSCAAMTGHSWPPTGEADRFTEMAENVSQKNTACRHT